MSVVVLPPCFGCEEAWLDVGVVDDVGLMDDGFRQSDSEHARVVVVAR